jgi:hypothetical protein
MIDLEAGVAPWDEGEPDTVATGTHSYSATLRNLSTCAPVSLCSCASESLCSCASESPVPSVSGEDVWEEAAKTLPQATGKRQHDAVFDLARSLKSLPAFADVDSAAFKPLLRRWHEAAASAFTDKAFEKSWFLFCDAWRSVRHGKGDGPFDRAVEAAKSATPPSCAMEYDSDRLRLLVSLTRELQRLAGGKPFPLSCRQAGVAVGCDHQTAAFWMRGLVADGVLERVKTHDRKKRLADEFRYLHSLED